MKTGIITYHNNENKGAILQAWCLAKAAQKAIPNSNVEIIDYRTMSKEMLRVRRFLITENPRRIPRRFMDWVLCQRFISGELPLSEERILTDDFLKAERQLQALDYDLLIVGSDEVWKTYASDSGIPFINPKRPFPNLYLPSSKISATKTSYAASANMLELNSLPPEKISHMRSSLRDFELISVRDNHTELILNELGIGDVYRVADPTILQEIPTKDVIMLLQENGIDPNLPIIGIHGLPDEQFTPVCEWYKDHGYQVVSPTISPHADVNLKSKVDPFEYYSLYKHFDLVLTSSLHSTIFSLKHRTPFITIDSSPVYKHTESKTKSLLRDFSLLNRHYDAVNGESEDLLDAVRRCETSLNTEKVDQSMSMLRGKSEKYLQKLKELQ